MRVRIEQQTVRVLAYHKPAGEVVSARRPAKPPTVFRRLPYLAQGNWQSVGRLDLNTEGLLLLTNSGDLANRLMHPSFGLEREYAVRVLGALTPEEKQRLLDGVMLDDGIGRVWQHQRWRWRGCQRLVPRHHERRRNREVRRIFETLGRAVSRLIRIRYGAMQLPRGLRRGTHLELRPQRHRRPGGRQAAPIARCCASPRRPHSTSAARPTVWLARQGRCQCRRRSAPAARAPGGQTASPWQRGQPDAKQRGRRRQGADLDRSRQPAARSRWRKSAGLRASAAASAERG